MDFFEKLSKAVQPGSLILTTRLHETPSRISSTSRFIDVADVAFVEQDGKWFIQVMGVNHPAYRSLLGVPAYVIDVYDYEPTAAEIKKDVEINTIAASIWPWTPEV